MTTKTKYNVGDKVRIIAQVAADCTGSAKIGGMAEITGSLDNMRYPVRYETDYGAFVNGYITPGSIELVDAKPTKNQRISALESQVSKLTAETADLQAQVARLQGVERVIKNVELAEHKPQPTPNELRKAIIAEAQVFVADITERMGNGESEYGEGNFTFRRFTTAPKFHINTEKRVVTALVHGCFSGSLLEKAIAKCAPGDVFNADIGKAIALGRALGLDVSKFEQAVQPTAVVAGMSVTNVPNDYYEVFSSYVVGYVDDGNAYDDDTSDGEGWIPVELLQILDDTEAQYE